MKVENVNKVRVQDMEDDADKIKMSIKKPEDSS